MNGTTPLFLLPGLGARERDILDEDWELSDVRDVLAGHGETTVLTHLPDIESQARDCTDFERVVVSISEAISARCCGRSPVVVGYSVGGFIAVEVCRRLGKVGQPVRLLVLLDASAVYIPSAKAALKDRISAAIRKGRKAAFVEIPFVVALRAGWLEPARLWLVISRCVFGDGAIRWVRMELLVRHWLAIIKKATLGPYDGRVLLLKARMGRPRITDPALGWTPYLSKLDVLTVEGNHWTMLRHADGLGQLDYALNGLQLTKPSRDET